MEKSKMAAQLMVEDEWMAKAVVEAFVGFRAAVELYEHGQASAEEVPKSYRTEFTKMLKYAEDAKKEAGSSDLGSVE